MHSHNYPNKNLLHNLKSFKLHFLSDWLLHHVDNRTMRSVNHNLLPDMCLPVLHVTRGHDIRLV